MIEKTNDFEFFTKKIQDIVSGQNKRAYVHTFGCQQNEADSEKIRGLLQKAGYILLNAPDNADVVIINTCAIRQLAELKALSFIGQFKAVKEQNESFVLGVCGCMAAEPHVVEDLKKKYRQVSFTLEPGSIDKLPELLYKALTESSRSFVSDIMDKSITERMPVVRAASHRAWVSIMYGCNNFCSYCIVPYVRGRERSRSSSEILRECEELVLNGYKEITLLGQNVNSYRSDMDFPTLLSKVAEIEGDFIIRFMTSHPKDASEALIDVMSKHKEKIAPHFHLPLQSGSDRILKMMNRSYDLKRYLSIVDSLRSRIPDISITSDMIVGFPSETDEDFEKTLEVMRTVRFDMVYSFVYSPREGTKAAKMAEQVDKKTKTIRIERLLKLQDTIAVEANRNYIGRNVRVLVDSKAEKNGETVYSARTDTNKLVHFSSSEDHVGKFVTVEITKAAPYNLFGRINDNKRKEDITND